MHTLRGAHRRQSIPWMIVVLLWPLLVFADPPASGPSWKAPSRSHKAAPVKGTRNAAFCRASFQDRMYSGITTGRNCAFVTHDKTKVLKSSNYETLQDDPAIRPARVTNGTLPDNVILATAPFQSVRVPCYGEVADNDVITTAAGWSDGSGCYAAQGKVVVPVEVYRVLTDGKARSTPIQYFVSRIRSASKSLLKLIADAAMADYQAAPSYTQANVKLGQMRKTIKIQTKIVSLAQDRLKGFDAEAASIFLTEGLPSEDANAPEGHKEPSYQSTQESVQKIIAKAEIDLRILKIDRTAQPLFDALKKKVAAVQSGSVERGPFAHQIEALLTEVDKPRAPFDKDPDERVREHATKTFAALRTAHEDARDQNIAAMTLEERAKTAATLIAGLPIGEKPSAAAGIDVLKRYLTKEDPAPATLDAYLNYIRRMGFIKTLSADEKARLRQSLLPLGGGQAVLMEECRIRLENVRDTLLTYPYQRTVPGICEDFDTRMETTDSLPDDRPSVTDAYRKCMEAEAKLDAPIVEKLVQSVSDITTRLSISTKECKTLAKTVKTTAFEKAVRDHCKAVARIESKKKKTYRLYGKARTAIWRNRVRSAQKLFQAAQKLWYEEAGAVCQYGIYEEEICGDSEMPRCESLSAQINDAVFRLDRKKAIAKMKRMLPSYVSTCRSALNANQKAQDAMRKAARRGWTSAYNKAQNRLNQTFRKGCEARRKAIEVWRAYKNSDDNIGANSVERTIRVCLRKWSACN